MFVHECDAQCRFLSSMLRPQQLYRVSSIQVCRNLAFTFNITLFSRNEWSYLSAVLSKKLLRLSITRTSLFCAVKQVQERVPRCAKFSFSFRLSFPKVPQFLLEAGYACAGASICVSEPRRIAASTLAVRVNHELGSTASFEIPLRGKLHHRFGRLIPLRKKKNKHHSKAIKHQSETEVDRTQKSEVAGYRVRYESRVSQFTKIVYLTEGILLREISQVPFQVKISFLSLSKFFFRICCFESTMLL
jgi:hypothetical protein